MLTVGISGASGAPLALSFLELARAEGVETELIVSSSGERTLLEECGLRPEALGSLVTRVYANSDIGAPPATGSRRAGGMVVIPCSMKTLAGIACGYSENLLLRAADVTLKERRRLVLVAREAPLSGIHLRNMTELSAQGAIIFPPVPAWYLKPVTMAEAQAQLCRRILDLALG